MFMKRHRLWPPLILLIICAAAAIYAEASLLAIPDHFQYLWAAPAPVSVEPIGDASVGASDASAASAAAPTAVNSGMQTAREGMEAIETALDGACEHTTLYGIAESVSVIADADGAEAVNARLEAYEDGAFALRPLLLKLGRALYPDEFVTGAHVAMIDESLAVALFNYAEPIGRRLILGAQTYRIVGIVNDSKRVGDKLAYTLYVPYRAIEKSDVAMSALCIETAPIAGAGGWSAFESAMSTQTTSGSVISLTKETMNAAMPFRVLLCAFGFLLVLFGVRQLNGISMRVARRYNALLRDKYALQLMPWLLRRALLLILGYAAVAFIAAQVFVQLIAPVYTFPEWVPAVLVEPNDISAAFWNVWQAQASLVQLRSPELIRTGFFGRLMAWSCGGCALFGGILAARIGGMVAVKREVAAAAAAAPDGTAGEPRR